MGNKTGLGLDENVEGLLCYVFGWVSGLVFILIEKDNKFVRFHAFQSFITFLSIMVVSFILGFIPIIGWLAAVLLFIVSVIVWIMGMVKAYQGKKFKIPIAGDLAEKNA
ncbi:MAG: hypothetical protein B1H08_06470 [Candidatus Omnitrophica bacterium 4484_171]|nr:MAG: hypothetical protein B1H08_06470 [Candidatus Omnitrophica bacterium 4484_171]